MAQSPKSTLRPVNRRRKPSQERSRFTGNAILDATEGLIRQAGIDRITTNKIAEEVGVTVGTLYGYFANKESVLFNPAQRWLEMNIEEVERGPPGKKTCANRVKWLDQVILDVFEVYRKAHGMTQHRDSLRFLPELREMDDLHERQMVKTLGEALAAFGYQGTDRDRRVDGLMLLLTIHTFLTRAAVASQKDWSLIRQRLRFMIHLMLLPRFLSFRSEP